MGHALGFDVSVQVLCALRDAGYTVHHRVINSLALLPQHRERVYLVGIRTDLPTANQSFVWPALPRIRARCVSGGRFGRRCPCRRMDGPPPTVRTILEQPPFPNDLGGSTSNRTTCGAALAAAEKEYFQEQWLTPTQWAKIEQSPSAVTAAAAAVDSVDGNGNAETCTDDHDEEQEEEKEEEQDEEAQTDLDLSGPHRRLVWLDGAARTLMANYRRGWLRYHCLCTPSLVLDCA